MICSGCSDRFSILRENPSEEVDYDNLIMNLSQETKLFWWALEIDFRYETEARKAMVDFQFDPLYR